MLDFQIVICIFNTFSRFSCYFVNYIFVDAYFSLKTLNIKKSLQNICTIKKVVVSLQQKNKQTLLTIKNRTL